MPRPSFIRVDQCASVELIYVANGVTMENVFHVIWDGDFTEAALVDISGFFLAWDQTQWSFQRATNCLLTRIRARALHSQTAPVVDTTLVPPRPGLDGLDLLPLNVTFAIKLYSSTPGRSYRGRVFVPGVNAHATSGNQMLVAYANAWTSRLTVLINSLAASNLAMRLVVVSYAANLGWRPAGLATPILGAQYVNLNLDSQRRRLTGRGL